MAQVIAGVARADDEWHWVEEARRRTVREMRALVRDGTGPEPVFAAADEPRVTLSVTVDREDGWLFEHARLLGKHAGTPGNEMLDALLAEGTTSLLAEIDRSLVVPFDGALEAARLVASVASHETVESWVERARERTVKHLREEVDAAQMLGRVGVDTTMAPPAVTTMAAMAELERRIVTGEGLQSGESQTFAGTDLPCVGRVVLKFRVGEQTRRYYRWLEGTYLRHGPRAGSFFRYLCLSFVGVWRERSSERPAYAEIYERDLFQCASPVCSRRDVSPHHLVFRSHGGDDSTENVASLCVWCHLEGVHGGMLTVDPPASAMRWRLGRGSHTVVQARRRVRVEDRITAK